jgi:hypothetical protein
LSEANVSVNVTYMTVLLKVNMKNLGWGKCLCKCYTYDCSSQSEYETFWVRGKCLCKCYIYDCSPLKVNMKNLEWGKCLCKCYIYDCSSQSKYEKSWVRQLFM